MAPKAAPAEVLVVRKLADRTVPVARFDQATGEPLPDPEPYAFAGLRIENAGGAPAATSVSTAFVARGRAEGWLTVEGEEVVHRPSGPASAPWSTPVHTFTHHDVIVLHTVDGDVRYRVAAQPDKYAAQGHEQPTDAQYAAGETRVDHFYVLELEG